MCLIYRSYFLKIVHQPKKLFIIRLNSLAAWPLRNKELELEWFIFHRKKVIYI